MNRKVKFYSSLDYSDLVAELRSGEDGLEYASADALEELMGRIQELEDALEAKDKRIAELEAKVAAMIQPYDDYDERIAALEAENADLKKELRKWRLVLNQDGGGGER